MTPNIHRGAWAVACVLLAACAKADGGAQPAASASPPPARSTAAARRVVLFVGTSLTAGLGVERDSAYPAVIQRTLDSLHLPWRAVNAGVSGETSAGALRRLPWLLREPPAVWVLETGANDGLRGLEADSTRANIEAIIALIRASDSLVPIVLVGMEAPPNMGRPFTTRFRTLYRDVALRHRVALVPFLLDGVGGVDSLNQPDGIHPTPLGHQRVADNVWRVLDPVLARAAAPVP